MPASTTKKGIIQRYERQPLAGYINPVSFLRPEGVEVLSADGQVAVVPYPEIKSVAFVRDFDSTAEERRVFQTRPKMEGLWVSLEFRDGEVIEGILPNNLLQVEYNGFTIIPPDPFSNTQRVFVPRGSLKSVEVLGVVRSPLRKRKPKAAVKEQGRLFEE